MENKHSKCFIVRQPKRLKFTRKMRNTFGVLAPSGPAGELKFSPSSPSRNEEPTSKAESEKKGRRGERRWEEGAGREEREGKGRAR